MHLAASSGFVEAMEPLVRHGVDVLDRVGCGPGFAGFTALHFVDLRSPLVWEQEFQDRAAMMRRESFPWIDKREPVAAKMQRDYEGRTQKCARTLENLMARTPEGRKILEMRAAR